MTEVEEYIKLAKRKSMNSWRWIRRHTRLPKGGYEYAATRIRIHVGDMFSDEDYDRFIKMDTREILRVMEEREYKHEVDELSTKYEREELVDRSLNMNMANTIAKLLTYLPEGSGLIEYSRRWDVHNIKTVLRSLQGDTPKEVVKEALIPVGTVSTEFIHGLLELETQEAVIDALKTTVYGPVLIDAKEKQLEELEDTLDLFYYARVLDYAGREKALYRLVQSEIDVRNVVLLFRLNRTKTGENSGYFVPGGTLDVKLLEDLVKKEVYEIVSALENKPLWKYVSKGTKELEQIEAGLRKYDMLQGNEMLKDYIPGFNTVLGYIRSKEREAANIRLLTRSKNLEAEDAIRVRSKMYLK